MFESVQKSWSGYYVSFLPQYCKHKWPRYCFLFISSWRNQCCFCLVILYYFCGGRKIVMTPTFLHYFWTPDLLSFPQGKRKLQSSYFQWEGTCVSLHWIVLDHIMQHKVTQYRKTGKQSDSFVCSNINASIETWGQILEAHCQITGIK